MAPGVTRLVLWSCRGVAATNYHDAKIAAKSAAKAQKQPTLMKPAASDIFQAS